VTVEEYKECKNAELKYYESMPKILLAFYVLISAVLPLKKLGLDLTE
jgi:hypothetical protein